MRIINEPEGTRFAINSACQSTLKYAFTLNKRKEANGE